MTILELLKNLYAQSIKGRGERLDLRRHKKSITRLAQKKLKAWRPIERCIAPEAAPFQVVDFFCGGGGTSLGFAALSRIYPFFRLIGGCDINSDAAKTYRRNFNVPVIENDIRTLTSATERRQFLANLDRYDENKPLIVIGCAPCQGFSSHRKKNWSKEDERNELVGVFASVAVKLNPVCIIMENVPEMLSEKYWEYFEQARRKFRQAGYVINQTIHNAAEYGVPQERFRALMIAMRRDFLLPDPLLRPDEFLTVRNAIAHLPPVSPGRVHSNDPLHRSAHHRPSTIETIRAVPKNGGSRPAGVGPKCLDRVGGFYDVYGRLAWDKPSITITHYARNPASGRYVHPRQDRGLTMREAALLQSFPERFEFIGSLDSVFGQIGNAVAPKFACGVAASVLVELLSPAPTQEERKRAVVPINHPVSSSFSSVIGGIKVSRVVE